LIYWRHDLSLHLGLTLHCNVKSQSRAKPEIAQVTQNTSPYMCFVTSGRNVALTLQQSNSVITLHSFWCNVIMFVDIMTLLIGWLVSPPGRLLTLWRFWLVDASFNLLFTFKTKPVPRWRLKKRAKTLSPKINLLRTRITRGIHWSAWQCH